MNTIIWENVPELGDMIPAQEKSAADRKFLRHYGRGQKTIAIKADAYILKELNLAVEEAAVSMESGAIPKNWEAYYEAWKLRGDCPKLYKRYDIPRDSSLFEGELRSGLHQIREKSLCCNYYKSYHFDSKVRKEGRKPHVFSVNRSYIKLITKIQEELREILTEKQIGIECNPTSNYKIGPFYRYEEHPMFRMYGKNLNDYPSARMNISINTDDMGIFQTSLEMEYAAMYMALKKSKDEKGNARYKKEQIKKWLEDVKRFGYSQAFRMGE